MAIQLEDGANATPSLTFASGTNTGIYRISAGNYLNMVANGSIMASWRDTGTLLYHGLVPLVQLLSDGVHISTTPIFPDSDNAISCGKSGNRWTAVFAVNGTIQTSHSSTKTEIEDLKIETLTVPRGITFKRPGDDRVHYGFLADDLPKDAFYEDGVSVETSSVIGVLCAVVRDLQKQVQTLTDEVAKLKTA